MNQRLRMEGFLKVCGTPGKVFTHQVKEYPLPNQLCYLPCHPRHMHWSWLAIILLWKGHRPWSRRRVSVIYFTTWLQRLSPQCLPPAQGNREILGEGGI